MLSSEDEDDTVIDPDFNPDSSKSESQTSEIEDDLETDLCTREQDVSKEFET